eukprot:7498758-Pyramimonas_sp.AAC.1
MASVSTASDTSAGTMLNDVGVPHTWASATGDGMGSVVARLLGDSTRHPSLGENDAGRHDLAGVFSPSVATAATGLRACGD